VLEIKIKIRKKKRFSALNPGQDEGGGREKRKRRRRRRGAGMTYLHQNPPPPPPTQQNKNLPGQNLILPPLLPLVQRGLHGIFFIAPGSAPLT
jgi:hypothetical protein